MPANPNKDDFHARRNIDMLLTKGLATHKKLLYLDVVREALLSYPVSRSMIEKFIKDFYIEPGRVLLVDGYLIEVLN